MLEKHCDLADSDSCGSQMGLLKLQGYLVKGLNFEKAVGPKKKGFISVFEIVFSSVNSILMTIAPAFFSKLDLGFQSIFISSGRICWKSVHRPPDHHG